MLFECTYRSESDNIVKEQDMILDSINMPEKGVYSSILLGPIGLLAQKWQSRIYWQGNFQ